MKKFFSISVIAFVFLACNEQNPQNEEAVKKVVMAFQNDFNEGGFKNATAYSTPDWVHINPGGGITKGQESVLKEVRTVHQSFLKGVTMQVENIDIRFVAPDVAIAYAIHKMGTYTTPDGAKHENEKHAKSYVIVKKQGKWLLVLDQNTIVQGSNTVVNQN